MEQKTIIFIECERCHTSFNTDGGLVSHYEDEWGESDLCDACASKIDALHQLMQEA